jgi:gamma-glutamylcyclotransferase (GGCT)/AIG2-like uncharacterized protein YtfP
LNSALACLNEARRRDQNDYYRRCGDIFGALNHACRAFFEDRVNRDTLTPVEKQLIAQGSIPTNVQLLSRLLADGLSSKAKEKFRGSDALLELARIAEKVASAQEKGEAGKEPPAPSHELNEQCKNTLPMLEELIEHVFDYPSNNLIVYGTLRPGCENHGVIAAIPGEWLDGEVFGSVTQFERYPRFKWMPEGESIKVKVLHSEKLSACYASVDDFEGAAYQRILVPVFQDKSVLVGNIYAESESA